MKNLLVLIGLISLMLCFQNCGPEERDCQVICDNINAAPQELLDYFVFNNGSYWVYQLNGTDTLDTLSIIGGLQSKFFELNAGCNYGIRPCEMRYTIFYTHSNHLKFPPLSGGVSNEIFSILYSQSRDQWDVSHVSGSNVSDLGFFLAYPFQITQKYSETTYLKDTSVEVTLPFGSFSCLQTRSIVSDPDAVIMSMYWSKKIGLIKYQISNFQTWNLINYHLK